MWKLFSEALNIRSAEKRTDTDHWSSGWYLSTELIQASYWRRYWLCQMFFLDHFLLQPICICLLLLLLLLFLTIWLAPFGVTGSPNSFPGVYNVCHGVSSIGLKKVRRTSLIQPGLQPALKITLNWRCFSVSQLLSKWAWNKATNSSWVVVYTVVWLGFKKKKLCPTVVCSHLYVG